MYLYGKINDTLYRVIQEKANILQATIQNVILNNKCYIWLHAFMHLVQHFFRQFIE